MNRNRHSIWVFLLVVLMPCVVAGPVRAAAGTRIGTARPQQLDEVTIDLEMPFPKNPEQVAELLQRIEEDAIDIRQDAERVLTFVDLPNDYSWLTHRWRLDGAEKALKDLQMGVSRLDSRADMLLDGQQAALDRIRPAASELGIHIQEAIDYLDLVRGREFGPSYSRLAEEIRDEAEVVIDASRLVESLTEVREELEALHSEP